MQKKEVRTDNRPSFLSAIDAKRKDERTTNRASFLSAIDAERKDERTTNRRYPVPKIARGKEGRADNKQTILSFYKQCREKGRADNKQTILSLCRSCKKEGVTIKQIKQSFAKPIKQPNFKFEHTCDGFDYHCANNLAVCVCIRAIRFKGETEFIKE